VSKSCVQVLQEALKNWGVVATPITHPKMQAIAANPISAAGYICHLQNHWFTIRPVRGQWWNFNSLLPAPRFVGLVYLQTLLETLRSEKWSIYVVQGTLPAHVDPTLVREGHPGHLWTPEEVRAAS
jgi:Ataxin-3